MGKIRERWIGREGGDERKREGGREGGREGDGLELTSACTRSIDPNLKTLVYGVGVAEGGEEAWNFVWDKYNTTDDPYEKRLLLRSLAESTEPWILSR